MKITLVRKTSGDFGHAGRPGKVGGSAPRGSRIAKPVEQHTKAYRPGEYYQIMLARGHGPTVEYFTINVGMHGDIQGIEYDGRRIRQYDGQNGEKFALDMIYNLDESSKWRELT